MNAFLLKRELTHNIDNQLCCSCVHTKILQPDDWERLKNIRLEALRKDGHFFASSYEKEKNFPEEYWRNLCTESKKHCVIGLFDKDKLVGITVVTAWEEDPTGHTALFSRSYIAPEYRRKGFSSLLYKARLEWAKKNPEFNLAVVFHREGNFISKKINERFGAQYWLTKPMLWADGQLANGLWYKVPLHKRFPSLENQ